MSVSEKLSTVQSIQVDPEPFQKLYEILRQLFSSSDDAYFWDRLNKLRYVFIISGRIWYLVYTQLYNLHIVKLNDPKMESFSKSANCQSKIFPK